MEGQDGDGTSFSITGGAGRVNYTLAEIEAAGRDIGLVGLDMQEMAATLAGELRWLADSSASLFAAGDQGATCAQYAALAAETFLAAARGSVAAAAQGVAELARHASAAVQRYEAAEAEAAAGEKAKHMTALLDGMQVSMAGLFGPVVMWGQARKTADAAGGEGLRDKAEDLLNDTPAYLAGLLGPAAGLGYLLGRGPSAGRANSGVWPAIGVRKFLDWSGLAKQGHVEMRKVPAGEWNGRPEDWRPGHAIADPPGGVGVDVFPHAAGLLAGSMDAYRYPAGSIIVDRLDRGDGSRAWIVHLPGTEDWSKADSTNPMDLEGDLEAMTAAQQALFRQQQTVVRELMTQALKDVGALPTEDVMITGHSGGGIHAAAAAGDPAFLADFNVQMIIIAGAPAKNQAVSSGVQVLDLENENDVVTATDYGPPRDAANWVAVTSHRPGATHGRGTAEIVRDAHDLGNYISDAAALESSHDPGIKAVRESVRAFMGAGIAGTGAIRVARLVYQGRDVNDPKPEKPQRNVDRLLRGDGTPTAR